MAIEIQERASKHKINLRDSRPVFQNEHGSIQQFTTTELPMLKNLSLQKVELQPAAILEPKWYINCNAIAYVIEGKTLVRTLDHASDMSTFTVGEGQMFHVHSGALFTVENITEAPVTVLFCARNEHPKEFSLSASAGAFTDAVLGNTWNVGPELFAKHPRSTTPRIIVKREGPAQVPENAHWPHPYRFDVEEMQAPTYAEGVGSAKKARSQYWKVLANIAMYSLRVEDEGMREPHWHPDTVELGFIREGNARMSIMDPDGSVDTFTLHPGDVYFIPASYPHQIEVLGDKKIHFLIFFDQPMPKDVGFRQAGTVMSRRVIAAAFGIPEKELPDFPYENEDPLLVVKKNAVDPVV
jgi:oxalate decarboxylase